MTPHRVRSSCSPVAWTSSRTRSRSALPTLNLHHSPCPLLLSCPLPPSPFPALIRRRRRRRHRRRRRRFRRRRRRQIVFYDYDYPQLVRDVDAGRLDAGFMMTGWLEQNLPGLVPAFRFLEALPAAALGGEPYPFLTSTPLVPGFGLMARPDLPFAIQASPLPPSPCE